MRWTGTESSGLGLSVAGCHCAALRTGNGPCRQDLPFVGCFTLGHLSCSWTRWKGLWHLPLPPLVALKSP
ncbi:hypothetical protein TNCT_530021 [Trichonephila clavata]|uniref:Uncharacterized protein n=1 Tax=Trichonephila clavata TaxID=2740835 RepID=A0A8X6EYD8_TRICU|nr:hypothetical protein TNCT_530021 [Trichonephila clavata]